MMESQTGHTNYKNERTLGKMKNVNVMEIVLYEIDIITKEQTRMVKYNNAIEDKGLRLMEFAKNSDILKVSKEARNNLLLNV